MQLGDVDVLMALITFMAAFGGAGAAFLLEAMRIKRKERRERVGACLRALFTIASQYDHLTSYWNQCVVPYWGHPYAFIVMPPTLPHFAMVPDIEVVDLSFLLGTKREKLLRELSTEQDRYRMLLQLINERNRLRAEIVDPYVNSLTEREGREPTPFQVVNALSDGESKRLEHIFAALKRFALDTATSHIDLHERFGNDMKRLFKRQNLVVPDYLGLAPTIPPERSMSGTELQQMDWEPMNHSEEMPGVTG